MSSTSAEAGLELELEPKTGTARRSWRSARRKDVLDNRPGRMGRKVPIQSCVAVGLESSSLLDQERCSTESSAVKRDQHV